MISEPLVSVIIPLYNAAPYIEQCLASVLGQTWANIEIIIVDDGSTDNSLAIASSFIGSKVKVLQQENAGASAARNTGLKHAKGTYIQFLDADDLISEEKIAAQVAVLDGSEDHLALCGTAYFDHGTDPAAALVLREWFAEGSNNPVDFLIKLYNGYEDRYGGMIQPNAWLTPKKLIDKAGLWNELRNPDDDGEFFCRVILASKGVLYTDNGISYYRKFKKKQSWSSRNNYESQAAVLQSWIWKCEHLKPYHNMQGIRNAMAFNFTELCYNTYPQYPDLSKKAYKIAVAHGGLSHPPYFGNKIFNKFRRVLPWRMLVRMQYYYHSVKKG